MHRINEYWHLLLSLFLQSLTSCPCSSVGRNKIPLQIVFSSLHTYLCWQTLCYNTMDKLPVLLPLLFRYGQTHYTKHQRATGAEHCFASGKLCLTCGYLWIKFKNTQGSVSYLRIKPSTVLLLDNPLYLSHCRPCGVLSLNGIIFKRVFMQCLLLQKMSNVECLSHFKVCWLTQKK